MMENASQANPRGELMNWVDEDIGAALDIPEEEVAAIRVAMQGKTLDVGVLMAWKRRQPKAEDATAADRKRAQRERDKSHDVTGDQIESRRVTVGHDRVDESRGEDKDQKHPSLRSGVSPAPPETSPVPYAQIVEAYNATMVNLPKVLAVSKGRKAAMRKAWMALPERHRMLAVFRAIFAECALDPFNNGTGPYSGDHAGWRPDFDYLIRDKVLVKVYEAAMERRRREAAAAPKDGDAQVAA